MDDYYNFSNTVCFKILEKVRFDADEDGDIRKSLDKQRNLIYTHISNSLD